MKVGRQLNCSRVLPALFFFCSPIEFRPLKRRPKNAAPIIRFFFPCNFGRHYAQEIGLIALKAD